ncbi:hypothetical protein DSECCO2_415300 [anaerobic digester metagenome]
MGLISFFYLFSNYFLFSNLSLKSLEKIIIRNLIEELGRMINQVQSIREFFPSEK